MTIPMVIGIVTIMAFSLVDTFFISLLGTQELAAIGFTYPVTFVILNFTMGLSIGVNVVLAKLLGQNRQHEAARVTSDSLLLSVSIIATLSLASVFFIDPLFAALGASNEIIQHIRDYMIPWFLGVSLLTIPMVGNGAIRASGDMKTPSIIMIIAGLVNGILDPLLIFGIGPFPELGIQGAAIATVIAWFCSMIGALYVLIKKKQLLLLAMPKYAEFIQSCKRILYIALPTGLSNMIVPLATGIVTAIVADFGEQAVAGFGVGARLEALSLVIAMALSASLTTFVGQNMGVQNYDRIKQAILLSSKFLLLFQLGVYAVFLLLSPAIAQVFSKEIAVQQNITSYLYILPISYGIQGISMIISAVINTLHKPLLALMINIQRLFIFYIPCSYLGARYWGFEGLLIGAMLSSIFAAFFAYFALQKELKKLN